MFRISEPKGEKRMKRQEIEPDYKEEGIELPQELIFADVFKILSGDANCCTAVCGQYNNRRIA